MNWQSQVETLVLSRFAWQRTLPLCSPTDAIDQERGTAGQALSITLHSVRGYCSLHGNSYLLFSLRKGFLAGEKGCKERDILPNLPLLKEMLRCLLAAM